jgi:RNA polymerase sigma-70 factor (ECF subfamily)
VTSGALRLRQNQGLDTEFRQWMNDDTGRDMMNDGLKAKGPKLVTAFSVAEAQAPDSDVIKRAQKGDADAFAALFHAHKARIYSICLRMTNNATEAEDLAQDALLQVFRKIATFRGASAFSTWLHRIAVNTMLMHFRKKSLNQVSLEEPYNDSDGTHIRREYGAKDYRLAGCVDRVALACAIKELPRGYRTIFLLHEVQGYDHQEIAEMLGCCAGNSKSQLHKAKLRIRERLARSPKAGPATVRVGGSRTESAGQCLRSGGYPSGGV